MSQSKGKIRECYRTKNGMVYQSPTEFPESNLPFMIQGVNKKNADSSIPATYWIEKYNEDTSDWEPIYP
jgi:hypothetical protein